MEYCYPDLFSQWIDLKVLPEKCWTALLAFSGFRRISSAEAARKQLKQDYLGFTRHPADHLAIRLASHNLILFALHYITGFNPD